MQDRRRKLTDEQKAEIISLYQNGLHNQSELARRFNVNRSTISLIVNPERAEKVRQRTKERWRDYKKNGPEWAAIAREHRRYKHELYLKGELSD